MVEQEHTSAQELANERRRKLRAVTKGLVRVCGAKCADEASSEQARALLVVDEEFQTLTWVA